MKYLHFDAKVFVTDMVFLPILKERGLLFCIVLKKKKKRQTLSLFFLARVFFPNSLEDNLLDILLYLS